jgi:hypothetical protein
MKSNEELTYEILSDIEPYVNEWVDSTYHTMRSELETSVRELFKEKMKEAFEAGQSSVSTIYNDIDFDFDKWYNESQK